MLRISVPEKALVALKKLDRFFVFLGGGLRFEGAEVTPLSGFRISFTRIETIARFDFPDHTFVT